MGIIGKFSIECKHFAHKGISNEIGMSILVSLLYGLEHEFLRTKKENNSNLRLRIVLCQFVGDHSSWGTRNFGNLDRNTLSSVTVAL